MNSSVSQNNQQVRCVGESGSNKTANCDLPHLRLTTHVLLERFGRGEKRLCLEEENSCRACLPLQSVDEPEGWLAIALYRVRGESA